MSNFNKMHSGIMKTYLFISVFLFSIISIHAQDIPQSLDLFTKRQILQGKFPKNDINLFVKGNLADIKVAVKKHGGHYKYGYKNLAAVTIPLNKMDAFVNSEGIEGFENGDIPVVPLTEQSIILNNVVEVHNGQSPLTQPYKGDDIIMGVIDDGIDFRHADFMDEDSNTRIRYIWDQRAANVNSPFPYGYGREWNATEIDAGNCTHVEPSNKFGHGTSVSGMACGNGNATGNFVGMAPNTEIIFVAINDQRNFLSTIVDAVDFIFKKADAIGKPCVINISYGTYFGPRDGIDFGSQMMELLLQERNGRVIVAAAGNAGHINYHLGYEVTSDTSFTWFRKIVNGNGLYISMFADTADFNNVDFAFAADDLTDSFYTLKGQSLFYSIKGNYAINPGFVNTVQLTFDVEDTSGAWIGTVLSTVTYDEGRYWLQVSITPQNNSHVWRFITIGSGRFDLWSNESVMPGTSNMIDVFPVDTTMPSLEQRAPGLHNYKFPDNQKTMVSSFQNSDKIITVANYNNRASYLNACGNTTFTGLVSGEINNESSRGPTRDNRQKPDIAATGTFTLATGNLANIAALIGSNNCDRVAADSLHQRNGGTSSASPHVAGAVALYLQKNPDAWWYEAKAAIIASAKQDTFTGNNLPDSEWGYGKLNAFAALQTDFTYGCTDTGSVNYDPSAQYDDGSCVAKRYGCMDPNALNYDSLANISDTCIFYQNPSSVSNLNDNGFIVAFPNPAKETINFKYEITNADGAFIQVTNILGGQTDAIAIVSKNGIVSINTSGYHKGIYIYRLVSAGKTISVNKFAVY